MCCECNTSALNVANITVSKRFKCCICNSMLSKLLQMQRSSFSRCKCHRARTPSVLLLQHYHTFMLQKHVAKTTIPSQTVADATAKCASGVANATIQLFKCGKCNNTDLKVLRLQQAKSFGCCICNNLCPEVLRMQQFRLRTVANATV